MFSFLFSIQTKKEKERNDIHLFLSNKGLLPVVCPYINRNTCIDSNT